MRPQFDAFTLGHSDAALVSLQWATQLLQDTSELVLIALCAWTLKRGKDRAMAALSAQLQGGIKQQGERSSLGRMMEGASAALSWVIWLGGGFVALQAYGVDIRPLLASLGASSIIIGIAAQSVLSNIVSGLALYASAALAQGDRVTLLSPAGGVVVHGVVQALTPARTVIRADDGAMIYVNNADVTKMLIKNDSQAAALA